MEKAKFLKKVLMNIFLLVAMLGVHCNTCMAKEEVIDTNVLLTDDSTFENSVGSWEAFAGGTIKSVANPSGTGNVLEFSTPVHTWDSPALDIRSLVQENAQTEAYVRVEMSVYSPNEMLCAMKVRVADMANLSIATQAGNTHPLIGRRMIRANEWTTITGEFKVTQDDLAIEDAYWKLCFDGISKYTDILYVDNIKVFVNDEEIIIPTSEEMVRPSEMKIGAIRWDAYTETTADGMDVASQVARILSPSQYHWQVPFFANISEEGVVSFPEYTLETWEQEAAYAKEAGLDYFAYIWYDTTDAMSQARKTHLESEKKDTIQMCGVLETIWTYDTMKELYLAMNESCYLRVNDMPVLFFI